MRLIKIAIGNVNTTVGAVRDNAGAATSMAHEMAAADATVGCFTEQLLGGYPPEDLVQWRGFVAAQRRELFRFADSTRDLGTAFVLGLTVPVGGQLFNVAAVVHAGYVLGYVPKEKLPTYNIFYEGRTFARGTPWLGLEAEGVPLGDQVFELDIGTIAVEVCEDAWSPDGPMRRRCYSGAELVINISASPYRVGVLETRREMLSTRSSDNQATLVYANAVGAQDGLIYDGGGFVFQNGRVELEGPRFREGWSACVVDLDRTTRLRHENTTWRNDCESFLAGNAPVPCVACGEPTRPTSGLTYPPPEGGSFFLPPTGTDGDARCRTLDDLFDALALGVKDYFVKTGCFRSFGIALSGGRDSLMTLLVAWRAAQMLAGSHTDDDVAASRPDGGAAARLEVFTMPSRFSGDATRAAAERICADLGVELRSVPIDEAFEREIAATRDMLEGEEPDSVTLQNIQARLRSLRMWNWSNTSAALFLQTGDMSEKAVGYTTIGGDLEGALSPIANVPKTVVIALLERLHERFGFAGIAATLATEPGPELQADQTAEAELMPFTVLDACLHLFAGEKLSPPEVAHALAGLFPDIDAARLEQYAERFARLFTRSIYKWVQSPLSLHVGSLDLDRERALQLPVVQQPWWVEPD